MTRNVGPICIGISLGDGPVSRNFAALATALNVRGFQVKLISHGPTAPEFESDHEFEILRWPSARPTRLADALFFDRLIRSIRPSCLISNFGATTLMMTLGAIRRVPVRIHWHHTLSVQNELDWPRGRIPGPAFFRWRARLPYRLATHHVANSSAAKIDLFTAFGVRENKCHVFWNSIVDPGEPATGPHNACCDQPVENNLLCVGRFFPSKGQKVLLRALKRLLPKHPSVRLEFIGDGPTLADCKAFSVAAGVQGHCTFHGKLPHRAVLAKMKGARATLVPSLAEAFGMVTIESMSLGVPVIASSTGGIPEIVRDGQDGFLVPPGDCDAIVRCLEKILENAALRDRLGNNARQRYLAHFDSAKAIQVQADWIENTIQEKAPAAAEWCHSAS